jgi:multiple sugar transport system ATP-binding protein
MKVHLEGVTKRFGSVVAVNDLNVTFESGRLIALLGPSGCGKSTLLYMLAGILPVTQGRIKFDEVEVTTLAPEKRGVGLVFQNYALYPHMTVLQNICFPLEIQKVPKAERLARAKAIADLVHIGDLLGRRPAELSGGQQQRVAITRALVKNPKLLLLDEPLSNLDARLRIEMREEIRRIQLATGVTTIFVTHDQEEALSISDAVLLMKQGEQQQYAQPQELYDQPHNLFVAEFLGTPPINRLGGLVRGGQFALEDGSAAFALPGPASLPEGERVILGVRAESVFLANNESARRFDATVTQVYRMGKEVLTHLQVGSAHLRGYLASEADLKAGDVLPIGLKDTGVFVFRADTGERCQ